MESIAISKFLLLYYNHRKMYRAQDPTLLPFEVSHHCGEGNKLSCTRHTTDARQRLASCYGTGGKNADRTHFQGPGTQVIPNTEAGPGQN